MADLTSLLKQARIGRFEIKYANYVDLLLVEVMAYIREFIGEPIIYTSSGEHYTGTAHSPFSLHKIGINHAKSKESGVRVLSNTARYKAFDVVCPSIPLVDFYWAAERFIPGGGLGIYPYWKRPGLHIDVRGIGHPGYGSRWWRDAQGNYHYNLKYYGDIETVAGGGEGD